MFNLIPWKKQKENTVTPYKREIDSIFDRFFEDSFFPPVDRMFGGQVWPSIDVSEDKKNITVKAELPGMEAKDMDLSLSGRVLTIKGEKKEDKEEKDKNYHRVERSCGYFSRSVELPAEVDETDVKASYKKGVLEIVMKKTASSESKRIEIKTA